MLMWYARRSERFKVIRRMDSRLGAPPRAKRSLVVNCGPDCKAYHRHRMLVQHDFLYHAA